MKICTYKRSTPFGIQKRLGIIYNDKTVIDVNLTWQAVFERFGYYAPDKRADLLAPKSLAAFLRLYQDASIQNV